VALATFQDATEEIARVGWTIANDQMAEGRDRAAALREIREAYNAMFEKLFDAGVFEQLLADILGKQVPALGQNHPAVGAQKK
jgi:hypothetical protein